MKWRVPALAVSVLAVACSPFTGAPGGAGGSGGDGGNAGAADDGGLADGPDTSGDAGVALDCSMRPKDVDCIDFNSGSTTAGYSGGVFDSHEFSATTKGASTNIAANGMLLATADSSVDQATISTTELALGQWTVTMRISVALSGDMEIARFDGTGDHITVRATTSSMTLIYNDSMNMTVAVDLTQLQVITVRYDGTFAYLEVPGSSVKTPSSSLQLINVSVGARFPGASTNAMTTVDYLYVLDHS